MARVELRDFVHLPNHMSTTPIEYEMLSATSLFAVCLNASSLQALCCRRKRRSRNCADGTFSAFSILVPPHRLQREFARRVRAVEKLKTAQRASLAELDALFASLQHRAFRGEL